VKTPLFSCLYLNICILGSILSAVTQLPWPQSTHVSGPAEVGINPANHLNQQPVSSSNGRFSRALAK
jgi:hypothetical protein